MPSKTESKISLIISRYVDLIILAISAAFFILILGPSVINSQTFQYWVEIYTDKPVSYQYFICLFGGVTINYILYKSRDYHHKHSVLNMSFWRYPPTRMAVILVLIFLWFFGITSEERISLLSFATEQITQLIFILTGLAAALLFNKRLFQINNNLKELKINMTGEKYKHWLYNDDVIDCNENDLLDRQGLVSRISSKLQNAAAPPDNEPSRTANHVIFGEFGSGKSTVAKLIQDSLINNGKNEWIFCSFDSWGRINNAEQLQEILLHLILDSISETCSISSLNNLPKDYTDALSGISPYWHNIIPFIRIENHSPDYQLQRISKILIAIDKHVLVTIEDLDRNDSYNSEYINKLCSLLSRIQNNTRIHFLFTIGYENNLFSKIHRVTRYREDLLIPEHAIEEILYKFRNGALTVFKEKKLHYFDGLQSEDDNCWQFSGGYYDKLSCVRLKKDKIKAVISYVSNIRSLKYILREMDNEWSQYLCGEVNFDDYLVINIIKEYEPGIFDIIINNNKSVAHGVREAYNIAKSHFTNDTSEIKTSTEIVKSESALILIEHLADENRNCFQTIIKDNKYLKIILDKRIPEGHERDQDLFKIIKEINSEISDLSEARVKIIPLTSEEMDLAWFIRASKAVEIIYKFEESSRAKLLTYLALSSISLESTYLSNSEIIKKAIIFLSINPDIEKVRSIRSIISKSLVHNTTINLKSGKNGIDLFEKFRSLIMPIKLQSLDKLEEKGFNILTDSTKDFTTRLINDKNPETMLHLLKSIKEVHSTLDQISEIDSKTINIFRSTSHHFPISFNLEELNIFLSNNASDGFISAFQNAIKKLTEGPVARS